MKLRELVTETGVSTETIQFYLREGVLPKPRKRGRAQADYGEHYIELIDLIKDLQEKHFLPLAVIKKVIKRLKKISPSEEHFFRMQSEFFSPVGYLLSQQEVEGEERFREITGLGQKWLGKAEDWGIITPEKRNGEKVFSSEDVAIGKVMVEMDRTGLGPKDGFDPEVLRHYKDSLQKMISSLNRTFTDQLYGNVSDDEFAERGFCSMNLMGVYFFYYFASWPRRIRQAISRNWSRKSTHHQVYDHRKYKKYKQMQINTSKGEETMKRVLQGLTLISVALLSISMLTACATAPQEQSKADVGSGTPGLYKNEEYRFTLNYPENWKHQKKQLADEVFRVASPINYNLPVLTATVSELEDNSSLDPNTFTDSMKASLPGSKRYKVLEQEDLTLNDGTPAKAFTYKWTWTDGSFKLVSATLLIIKDGNYLNATVTTALGGATKPAQLLEIAKSWKFF